MNGRDTASSFLRSRRDRISPQEAGLPVFGSRRVAGLRRGEVAVLAGVSVEYYTRLERGDLRGVSAGVLDAIARALRLDAVEQQYLHDLARAANAPSAARTPAPDAASVPASLQLILDAMPDLPAFVTNHRMDTLAANVLGRALYSPMWADPASGRNAARWGFLSPAAKQFYLDWEEMADFAASVLRAESAKHPGDRVLSGLIEELSARSQDFRAAWAGQNVSAFQAAKRLRHPIVGELSLRMEILTPSAGSGLSVVIYTPIPGTGAEDGLKLLAAWSGSSEQDDVQSGRARSPEPHSIGGHQPG